MPKATHAKPTLTDGMHMAQLQRDVMGLVVHDLGSIAGALSVRAALPAPADAAAAAAAHERQQAAMQELSRQLRSSMQLLELARGTVAPRQDGAPAASGMQPTMPADMWMDHLRVMSRGVLPRQVPFAVGYAQAETCWHLDMADAAVLTRVIHAAWHGVMATCRAGSVPHTVELVVKGGSIAMTAELAADALVAEENSWRQFSTQEAADAGYVIRWWEPAAQPQPDGRLILTWSCARAPGGG